MPQVRMVQRELNYSEDPLEVAERDTHLFMWCPVQQCVPAGFFFIKKILLDDIRDIPDIADGSSPKFQAMMDDLRNGEDALGMCCHRDGSLVLVRKEGWNLRPWIPSPQELEDNMIGIQSALESHRQHQGG